ncbi:MAG: hypothetical protein PWQ55_2314 [Chloroflexota bacterium]|nr:hypothetical protein [Chloroflexota bacterium]
MQVILTHEQADFDALASMLGAYLLQKEAYAVLPAAMNRNVQSFVHLYGADLPFVEAGDLPNEPIESVTLVDTQSMITLKGMRKSTEVFVIDHHTPKADFPKNWHLENVDTIACTTRFVENLQEHNGHLSMIQATLLLLGIYEDSGSLSYAHTTPRDVSAVAYLLESGASLKLAANFLNQPLSAQQHAVLDEMLTHLEAFSLQNCKVLVSWADAPELEDEVSSIAHKLSDLLDPDALFIFVRTREGIRLVARSTTDQVNVADIAKTYNGGGHARAASALIRSDKQNPEQLLELVKDFKNELPVLVAPVVTVSQIMSKKPLTISPETTARQAYQLMQHFGYEGYPVVQDGQVKGLLTRRAVDRALAHNLSSLTADNLMEAGNVSVSPTDPLDTLQRIMADSGWGQVPVVDPRSGKIIAITTRTDLLKVLAGGTRGGLEHRNLSAEISTVLPPARLSLLRLISRAAQELQLPIFVVGGFARDLLLKVPSFDLDCVVEGDALDLAYNLANAYGGRITSHQKFGTAKWQLNLQNSAFQTALREESPDADLFALPDSIDLISSRTEFYEKPSALPIVQKSSIKLDLHRRDFTINTMAVRLDGDHFGELYDYWGGFSDLKKGLIRVLHSLSFVDDPTRMLRAVRFEQRFGFAIEERTLKLMRQARTLLKDVSGERIRHEIDLILLEKEVVRMMARLADLGLMEEIHPALRWNEDLASEFMELFDLHLPRRYGFDEHPSELEQKIQVAYILWMLPVYSNDLSAVTQRLRLKTNLSHLILQAHNAYIELDRRKKEPDNHQIAVLQGCPPVVLYALWLHNKLTHQRNLIEKYAVEWRHVKPLTDGKKLMKMGVPASPRIGEILDELRAAWIDGRVSSEAEEEALLQTILRD